MTEPDDDDIEWLQARRCTCRRTPVGWRTPSSCCQTAASRRFVIRWGRPVLPGRGLAEWINEAEDKPTRRLKPVN